MATDTVKHGDYRLLPPGQSLPEARRNPSFCSAHARKDSKIPTERTNGR
jgi:hypothetical protein